MKKFLAILFAALTVVLSGCGGGGGGSESTRTSNSAGPGTTTSSELAPNAVAITVDGSMGTYNRPYVSVTVCAPGTAQCATVDHVLVDTASVGLRLLRSALPGSLGLTNAKDPSNGSTLAECAEFASGHLWGPISTVDLKMAGETASAIPMQIVDDSFANVPASCSDFGGSIASGLFANGVIGLQPLLHDCDSSALCNGAGVTTYYDCTGSNCDTLANVLAANQVPNPVSKFSSDSNGIVITLPSVPAGGSPSVSGALTFGVNTQTNNQMGSQTQMQVSVKADVKVTYNNQLDWAFLDTGSSADFFSDSSISTCSGSWFCPGSNVAVSATLSGISGTSQAVSVNIGNAISEINNGNGAYSDIGQNANVLGDDEFDLGLPFFFGKSIYFGYPSNPDFTGTWPFVVIQG
jgi:hypothetical protein